MKPWRPWLLVLLAAAAVCGARPVATLAQGQATVLEVISLRYRTATEVVPVVQPMLAPGGTVSAFQGQLVVRTTPENMAEVRRILAAVDTPPRRLLITVRQDAEATRDERGADVSARGGSAGSRAVRAGTTADQRDTDVRVQARIVDSRSADSDRNVQTVQVTEGSPAYIRVGQAIPVPGRRAVRTYSGGQYVEDYVAGVEYIEVASGFYALPRVAGDRVILEISPQREALSGQIRGGVNVQRAATTVAGRLGEWIEVAGSAQASAGQRTVILGATSATGADTRRVLVKVEELK